MSASKEKKTRQAQAASGWVDPKTAREAKQQKEIRRSNILYGIIAVVFVVVAVATFVWKSNIIQKSATAATINGKKYSAAEMQYYYGSVYQQFMNNYGSYASYFGLDTSKSLRDQECSMDEDGGTWFDYFAKQALEQAADIDTLCTKAEADNMAWNSDMQATLDENLQSLKENVDSYNQTRASSISEDDYLKLIYGNLMNKKIFEAQMKKSIQAQAYSDSYAESLTYSDADLETAYNDDRNSYDMADYESVRLNGSAESTTDADGNTVEPTEEEEAAALKKAKADADAMYARFRAGEDLSELAEDNDKASYSNNTNATYYDSVVMNWVFDNSRKAGDSAVLADEESDAYYVVSFGRRFRPKFLNRDVRHILISPEDGQLDKDDEGYEAEQKQLKLDAEKKAADLLSQYNAGEQTEEAFSALAVENSDDTGSAANGGLIAGINESSSYVENFKNWALDSHQPGDTGIVESDYGYHIMYYVGNETEYWKDKVESTLSSNDYNAWYEEQTKDAASTQASGMKYVG